MIEHIFDWWVARTCYMGKLQYMAAEAVALEVVF